MSSTQSILKKRQSIPNVTSKENGMRIVTRIDDMQSLAGDLKRQGKTIGFVPTMGFLHEGHLALLKKARKENDIVVLSIFVNPLQFGPSEDLSNYPRNFMHDSELAEQEKTDIIFHPSAEEVYPRPLSVLLNARERTNVLCGKSRPGHFDGVAAVVTKLFHIVQPNKVYFGMKDAQQIAVVHGLVNDLNFPFEVVPVETVREVDGLAKSSRNVNLLPIEREQAPVLYRSLLLAKEAILGGERNIQRIRDLIRMELESNTDGDIDYIEIFSYPDLKEISQLENTFIIALAVKYSRARLIDNIIISL